MGWFDFPGSFYGKLCCFNYHGQALSTTVWNWLLLSIVRNWVATEWGYTHIILKTSHPVFFLIPNFSLHDVLCDHLEERDPIWGDDWSHSPFIRRSPSWGFLGFSTAVRQMPGYLCTASRTISLSPLSLATDLTDETLGASGLWLGTRTGADGTATLNESLFFFWPQPMAPWTTGWYNP